MNIFGNKCNLRLLIYFNDFVSLLNGHITTKNIKTTFYSPCKMGSVTIFEIKVNSLCMSAQSQRLHENWKMKIKLSKVSLRSTITTGISISRGKIEVPLILDHHSSLGWGIYFLKVVWFYMSFSSNLGSQNEITIDILESFVRNFVFFCAYSKVARYA